MQQRERNQIQFDPGGLRGQTGVGPGGRAGHPPAGRRPVCRLRPERRHRQRRVLQAAGQLGPLRLLPQVDQAKVYEQHPALLQRRGYARARLHLPPLQVRPHRKSNFCHLYIYIVFFFILLPFFFFLSFFFFNVHYYLFHLDLLFFLTVICLILDSDLTFFYSL